MRRGIRAAPSTLIGIVGPGRAGTGLGLALAQAGYSVRLHGRRKRSVPDPLTLTVSNEPPAWLGQAGVVVLAVPDDAIRSVAEILARQGTIKAEQVILHLSGVHGQEALGPLVSSRAALGSLHPLQTIADPRTAPERLRAAWAAVEGMPVAIKAAEELARAAGMRPFRVTAQMKPVYHAGAVFAANYFVVVEAVAQRLLRHTGLSDKEAWEALKPLVRGSFENLMSREPREVLTGPIDRGDETTIARHLASLTEDDARLYRELGRAALELAVKRGMAREIAERIGRALE